jgi:hypothetical protein
VTWSFGPAGSPDDVGLADRFLAGHPLLLRLETGTPAPGARGLFRVVSGPDGRELLTLTVDGTHLFASMPLRADRVGLARPRVRAPGILAGSAPGDTVHVVVALLGDGGLRLEGPGGRWHRRGPDPSMGWSLLYFTPRIGPAGTVALGFLWCAFLLFAPAAVAPDRHWSRPAGLGLIALLAGVPLLVRFLAPLPLAGWAGVLVGSVAGGLARAYLDRRPAARQER